MIETALGTISMGDLKEMQGLERKSKLPVKDKVVKPTVSYLKAVAEYFEQAWGKPVTVSQAYQIWIGSYVVQEVESQRQVFHADVSAWYGINPFELAPAELLGLHGNLPRIKAQQRIESQNFDATNFEAVEQLFLAAYDDEQLALEARNQAIKANMDSKAHDV
tara:strand:+ start:455 stop:943 length:489 start_codon:yes stop_codon:yes gene_type:complete